MPSDCYVYLFAHRSRCVFTFFSECINDVDALQLLKVATAATATTTAATAALPSTTTHSKYEKLT